MSVIDTVSLKDIGWPLKDLEACLKLLDCHVGFPMGLGLQCPIWSGNKYHYLQSVCEISLPTLKIPLHIKGGIEPQVGAIIEWMKANPQPSDGGYIRKAPFVQNQLGYPVTRFSSLGLLMDHLRRNMSKTGDGDNDVYAENKSDLFPYIIMQPYCRFAKFERKVLLLNMEPVGFNLSCSTARSAKTDAIEKKYFDFAREAIRLLKERCPHAVVDGLTRVDIFQMDEEANDLRVNEFESLDSNFGGRAEMRVKEFLEKYWTDKLDSLISLVDLNT